MLQVKADTTFGKIGVKVWIYKGEILKTKIKKVKKKETLESLKGGN